jgi:LysM repeat protein
MKRISLICIALLVCTFSFAQDPHASLKKVTQNGIEFYLYEVAEGDGLYKISNSFHISQEEIMQFNPQAVSGLQKGMTLRIPTVSTRVNTVPDIVMHKVKKGETIYFITKRYAVDEKTLLDWNPWLSNGLKEGDEVKIPIISAAALAPAKATTTAKTDSVTAKSVEHLVEAKETVYSLSKQYNVSVDDIIKYNPGAEKGIKAGEYIKIPAASSASSTANETKPAAQQVVAPGIVSAPKPLERTVKVALLLPFMLNNEEKQDATIDKFVEFYEGFLLGVNKLKEERISVELFTYDIEKTDTKLKEVLTTNPEIRKVDLIFGPAYSSQLPAINSFAQQYGIYTVIPFAPKIETIGTNPYLFQNNAPVNSQLYLMANLFVKNFSNKNIVLINVTKDATDKGVEFIAQLKAQLKYSDIDFNEITITAENPLNLNGALSTKKETIAVVGSENPALIKDILASIESANKKETPVSVFGFSEWESMTATASSVYYFSPFYVNKNNLNVISYRELFQQEFGYISPQLPQYDLMGYDLSTYFIKAVSLYGKKFPEMLTTTYKQENPLQSKFQFKKQNKGGYINNTMQLIHSADYGKTVNVVE